MRPRKRSTSIEVSRTALVDFESAHRALHIHPGQLLQQAYPAATVRETDGVSALLHLPHLRWLSVPVAVEFRTPSSNTGAVIEVHWKARRFARAFPVMHALLRVRPQGSGSTEVILSGEYRVPLGLLGLIGDQVIGARGASATAGQFLDEVVQTLASELAVPR